MKTDLDLGPIYLQNENATMAHLHLVILAYWLVNTIRYQLKAKKIIESWSEIARIENTQKLITTVAPKEDNQWLGKKTCSVAEPKLLAIYEELNY